MRSSFATFTVILALAFGASSADAGLLDGVKKALKDNQQAEQNTDDAQNAQSSTNQASRKELRAEADKPNLGSRLRKLVKTPGAIIDNAVIKLTSEKQTWEYREAMRDVNNQSKMRFIDHPDWDKTSDKHEHGQRLDAAADRYEAKLRQRIANR